MEMRRKRTKSGDVLELEVPSGFAYLHYLGKHPEYGDAMLVSPQFQERRVTVTADIFLDAYVAFYPVTAAVSQGLLHIVGHLRPPVLPSRLRRAGARSGRRVDTWVIEGGSREVVKSTLSDDELRLPIASIWNHELLLQRIAEGWTPVQEDGHGS
jgi:hypothetical protein